MNGFAMRLKMTKTFLKTVDVDSFQCVFQLFMMSSRFFAIALLALRFLPAIPQAIGVAYLKTVLDKTRFCSHIKFLEDVWFSDEAHLLLSGHVNSKNNVFLGSEIPDVVLQRPLHSVKARCGSESC